MLGLILGYRAYIYRKAHLINFLIMPQHPLILTPTAANITVINIISLIIILLQSIYNKYTNNFANGPASYHPYSSCVCHCLIHLLTSLLVAFSSAYLAVASSLTIVSINFRKLMVSFAMCFSFIIMLACCQQIPTVS